MNTTTIQDRIRGSLVGGAVGDALGYPVEFMSYAGIVRKYGDNGIVRYELDMNSGKALISDDTQMTLFTACGLLNSYMIERAKSSICEAYIEWYHTQIGKHAKKYEHCWIKVLPEMNQRRAPGNTCLSALRCISSGGKPINNSKGCGGIMRTAPVALYGVAWKRAMEIGAPGRRIPEIKDVDELAAYAAEITHQHPLGWLPSALEAHIIYRLIENESPSVEDFKAYIVEGHEALNELFSDYKIHIDTLRQLTDKALRLVDSSASDVENIEAIGEGWTGDEALAIAIYCTAKYFDNFEKAVIAAVNHKGDSDSTGAITGNILGSVVGYEAIPQHFKENLELHVDILHMADDLCRGEKTKFY